MSAAVAELSVRPFSCLTQRYALNKVQERARSGRLLADIRGHIRAQLFGAFGQAAAADFDDPASQASAQRKGITMGIFWTNNLLRISIYGIEFSASRQCIHARRFIQ